MFRFSNTNYETAADIMELPDHDLVVVGNSSKCVGTTCDHAAGMVRTDPNGNVRWFTKMGNAGADMTAMATCPGNDGKLMFLAHYSGNSVLSKLDTNGTPLWHSMVEASGTFWPRSVVGLDSAYFVAGQIYDGGNRIAYVQRVEEDGSFGWIKFFQIPGSLNEFHCIRVNAAGELVLTGTGDSSNDIVGLVFMNTSGNLLRTWGFRDPQGLIYPLAEDLIITSEGNYVLSFRGNNGYFCMMEVSATGNIRWAKRYLHGQAPAQKVNIVEGHYGGYFAMGTRNFFSNSSSILSMRINDDGEVLRGLVIDNTDEDRAHRLIQAHNCGYLLVSMSEGMGTAAWAIARADSSGLIGTESGNPSLSDVDLVLTPDTFIVNPYTYAYNVTPPNLAIDYPAVVADSVFHYAPTGPCSTPVAIKDPVRNDWKTGPNPVSDFLHIIPPKSAHSQSVYYRILDLQGRMLASGEMKGAVDVRELPSGMYLLELRQGNERKVVRVMKGE